MFLTVFAHLRFLFFVCSVTSRSLTRRVRRHSTVKRNRSTAKRTALENTRTRTRPSSMKTGHSLVSTEVARRAASVLTRTGRRRRRCRHSYNGQSVHRPHPAYFDDYSRDSDDDRCCCSCSFVLSSENWQMYQTSPSELDVPCWSGWTAIILFTVPSVRDVLNFCLACCDCSIIQWSDDVDDHLVFYEECSSHSIFVVFLAVRMAPIVVVDFNNLYLRLDGAKKLWVSQQI